MVIAAAPEQALDEAALLADGWTVESTVPPLSYLRGGTRLLAQEVVPGTYLQVGYPLYSAAWETEYGPPMASEDVASVVPSGARGTVLVVSTEYFRE